jgi:pSer/pThr/pTyr-binding forkhead associated (FHA) protein
MIICENCQSRQFDGAIFCLECGANLQPRRDPTRPLPQGKSAGATPNLRPAVTTTARSGASITLVVLTTRQRITLDASEELLIGREDAAHSIHPDIDLGEHGGYDAGVSRRHAILAYRNGEYSVEDLGSANGTFVNGKRLEPHAVARLSSGDELACGTLPLRIELP